MIARAGLQADTDGGKGAAGKLPLHQYGSASVCSTVLSHYGIDSTRYNALAWLTEDVVAMASGKFVLFLHLTTGVVESQEMPVEGGAGVVAVHPSRRCYVVGQRAMQKPGLVVFEWPSRKPMHTFEDGAVVGFSALTFDLNGSRMASVADGPDFTLCVWDWESKSLILRNKCFGTDVYSVAFSRFDNSLLVTGGVGHIKFWSMANTFTGKKLQGTIGKFGRLEISDISGFAVLPDGKVISGSESGCLLLWEGDLVKCSFVKSIEEDGCVAGDAATIGPRAYNYVPAHNGSVGAVQLIHDGRIVVSCGDDGYIRYWDRDELDQAEGEGAPALYAPKCLLETHVKDGAAIQSLTVCDARQEWVVLDRSGAVMTAPYPTLAEVRQGAFAERTAAPIELQFNGGGILCAVPSPTEHIIFTGGEDGFVRAVNYIDGIEEMSICAFAPAPSDAHAKRSCSVTSLIGLSSPQGGHAAPFLIAAGSSDGCVCVLETGAGSLVPRNDWKPHTDPVLTLCADAEKHLLCSVSTTGTVFFFSVDQVSATLEPIGFCQSPISHPLCAAWDVGSESGGVLLGYASGQVLSIACPQPGEVDTSVSFEFTPRYALVGIRQRKLPPPVPDDEKLNAAVTLEDDILEEPDNGPWPVVLLQVLPTGQVAIGMDKEELVYAYSCCVRYPGRTELPPLPPTGVEPDGYVEEPGRNLCFRDRVPRRAFVSSPQTELLIVCAQAQVLVQSINQVSSPHSPTDKPSPVSLVAASHDCTRGAITSAHTSFDGSVFITTGTDGLVVSSLREGCTAPASRRGARATAVKAPASTTAAAVVDTTLSIQQQKEAHDEAQRQAAQQERLDRFLARLRTVQQEYETVLEKNAKLPPAAQLTSVELELDSDIVRDLDEEKARRVKEARREFALDAAREGRRTAKLRHRFVDNLLYDRVVLHAFSRRFDVASFRTVDPSEAIERLENDMALLRASDEDECDDAGTGIAATEHNTDVTPAAPSDAGITTGQLGSEAAVDEGQPVPLQPKPAPPTATKTAKTGTSASVKQQLEKQEQRQRERDERRRGYNELLSRKPDPAEDTKRLQEQLAADLAARGECVFRTDPTYTGDPDFQPTAAAKLQRMIDLQRLLVAKKSAFNETLLEQRKQKQDIIEQVNAFRTRIEAINTQLKDHRCDASKLILLPDECPEKLFQMSRADLDTYAVRMAEEKARQEQAKQAQRGFGADLAGATRKESGSSTADRNASASSPRFSSYNADPRRSSAGVHDHGSHVAGSGRHRSTRSGVERGSRSSMVFTGANRDRMDAELRTKLENIRLSELEEEEMAMMRLELLAERERLATQAQQLMNEYDDRLQRLLDDRMRLDGDVCFAEGHLLLLFREYQMLLLYRKRDKELRHQLVQVQKSRESARREIDGFKKQEASHEAALARAQEKQKELKKEAEAYIHANAPADKVAYLLKIYHRHIKRRKKGDDEDDNDDITSDEDEEDDLVDDIGEEVCPPSCEPEVWAAVLQYRERRLDLVDLITDEKASSEMLRRKAASGLTTVSTLSSQVEACLQQIKLLEAEKRKELNQLDMVVPLRCDQVKCLVEGHDSSDLRGKKVLVVSDEEMLRLRRRVYELCDLKAARRDECDSMLAEQQTVQGEKTEARSAHSEWESKVYEVMMLKFGQQVDLEMLESCGSSRRIEAKKEQLRQVELRWERTLRQYEHKINELRAKMQDKITENTYLLQDYGNYEGERQEIERALGQSTAKTVQRYRGAHVATKEDRANLRELIAAQQEEIDALTAEIMMLSRKGGHAYSPQMEL